MTRSTSDMAPAQSFAVGPRRCRLVEIVGSCLLCAIVLAAMLHAEGPWHKWFVPEP